MNIRKSFITGLTALLCTVSAWADGYRSVIVKLQDGSTTQINLRDDLKTSFNETDVVFSDHGSRWTFAKADVVDFTFSEALGIRSTQAAGTCPELSGRVATFGNLPAGSHVSLFSADGRTLRSAEAAGSYRLSLEGLPAGSYVVSVNGVSYKIQLK